MTNEVLGTFVNGERPIVEHLLAVRPYDVLAIMKCD